MATASPPRVQVKDKIDLTEKESQIFNRLLEVISHFNLNTKLRVAGGWVRDKLLGKDCYDIDIAIDNMLGREFCEKVSEYMSSTGEEVHSIGVIQCNPDQSKHLETARMRLFDVWVDFVNLRSEDYCENSRIPLMRFGTAEEDAYRRDLTINSLFYNINTNSVEDLTGRGIADLKSGKIMTPLPPKETFLDDPLRVLRAIRFGARFGFVLDVALKEAAASDEVLAAIGEKISRERIGHEIDLMISGSQPVQAVTYICDLRLFWVVFNLPSRVEPATPDECERLCLAYMDAACNLMLSIGACTFNDEQRRLALYATLLLPFRETVYRDNKKKKVPVADFIIRNSLKLKVKDAETVISIHHACNKFATLLPFITLGKDVQNAELEWGKVLIDVPVTSKLRIWAGLLVREIKDFWKVGLLVSTLLYPDGTEPELSDEHFNVHEKRALFKSVEDAIIKLGLDKVWEVKPLLNGKDIMSILRLKPGPDVRDWTKKIIEWQLAHPAGTADECLEWMKETGTKRVKIE
ncbi:hypothetical protein Nepgr_002169 [Nepenthes gracilis]|uniref:Poly A polymerase head domain-containing protein n=1 Tax=Nepenthes gracilis TaxID=150966 RepID=A0AAD3P3H3_NEPGR|nr:hypothetical protein Nepgr_002169 [Nepenthes gracilis]